MSTATFDPRPTPSTPRTGRAGAAVRVTRLHLIGWALWPWPWAILATSFVINLVIFGILQDNHVDPGGTGGLASIYIVQIFAYSQLCGSGFPFALGLSVTRRAFWFGTALYALGQALLYGAGIAALRAIEDGTGGWGVQLRFFGLDLVRTSNPVLQYAIYVVPFLLAAAIGSLMGFVFQRWGANGLMTLTLGSLVLGGLAAIAVTWQHRWTSGWHWLAGQPHAALFAGWPALITVLVAAAGYLVLRRATA